MARLSEVSARLASIQKNFIDKGQFQPAVEDLLKLQDEFGNMDVLAYYLGVCYVNMGEDEFAAAALEFVSSSEELTITQIIQTNMLLGYVYTRLEDMPRAERYLKAAIDINPQSSMAHSALGYVYFLSKRYDMAITHFKRALQIDPNNAGAHNNLGYTYCEVGINLNEAIASCRKAVALNPKSAAYHDSLGWAYFNLQNYKDAVKEFEQAISLPCENKSLVVEHMNLAVRKRDLKTGR